MKRSPRGDPRSDGSVAQALLRRVNWVLDADIRPFFNTIAHGWMQKFIQHRIGDRRLVRLLMKWATAGVMKDGKLHEVTAGTPQSGIISPLLANVDLHCVFDLEGPALEAEAGARRRVCRALRRGTS